jgi:tripartite-type tricarboxylate transporter receptor subunit TctC
MPMIAPRKLARAGLVIAAVLNAPQVNAAQAESYPTRAVRIIVPLAPGGGSDIVARMIAQALSERWGRPVVVDNRPGAGSVVGTALAAKASADGYTLLVSSSSLAISPALYPRLEFDVKRDFAPVSLLANQPSMLVVHPSVPAGSLKELVALVVKQPGKLAYASAGNGSATHLGTELLMHTAGLNLLHVPYKSAGQAASALLAGEAQVLLTNMASVLPHLASGRIRALGISSLERSPLAPEVPTLHEAGLPKFEYATWYAMVAPARTPAPLVKHIHETLVNVSTSRHVVERMRQQGLTLHASSPAELARYLDSELDRWVRVVKAADIRLGD